MTTKKLVGASVFGLLGAGYFVAPEGCDDVCTSEARASAIVSFIDEDARLLDRDQVPAVWFRVTDASAPRSFDEGRDLEGPGVRQDPDDWIAAAPGEWDIGHCEDEDCTRWVLGYELPGLYEIRASVCGRPHAAEVFVRKTPDDCHVETEYVQIDADTTDCPAPGPVH